jgi:enterobactin synthetase component D
MPFILGSRTLMTATLTSHALPIARPTSVLSALRPAPHELPPRAIGASLALDDAHRAMAQVDRDALPASCRAMAPRRLLAFLAGRWCAQTLLERLGLDATVGRGSAGEPLWPEGCTGSITHTDRAAYAAVLADSPRSDLGIDSEPFPDPEGLRVIREDCCSEMERQLLFAPGSNAPWVAAAVFSAKEAYYKAMHRRVRHVVEFDEVEATAFTATSLSLAPVADSPLRHLVPPAVARLTVHDQVVHACIDLPFHP